MTTFNPPLLVWLFVVLQVLGLASGWWARLCVGSALQSLSQSLFFVALTAVGTLTMIALLMGPGACIISGATLSVMVLIATWDFSQGRQLAGS
jgi:hypothetical protein